jgi:hypothetical protein
MAAFGGDGEKPVVSKVESVSEVAGGGEAVAARRAAGMAVGSMVGYGPVRSCRASSSMRRRWSAFVSLAAGWAGGVAPVAGDDSPLLSDTLSPRRRKVLDGVEVGFGAEVIGDNSQSIAGSWDRRARSWFST